MTKEEKIKEAYGEYFEKCNPDENGWFWSENIIFSFCKNWDKIGYRKTLRFRPKSLSGIENNNGWVKIESEVDLPREELDYFILYKNEVQYFSGRICDLNEHATHYQPIKKPEPPIY